MVAMFEEAYRGCGWWFTPAPSATGAAIVSRDLLHRSEQAKPSCVTALLSGSGVPGLSMRPDGFSRCAKSTEIAFSDFRGADEQVSEASFICPLAFETQSDRGLA